VSESGRSHCSKRSGKRSSSSSSSSSSKRPAPGSQFDVDSAPAGSERDETLGPRDDDVLPDSLAGALQQAADATAEAVQRSNCRCQVELLLTEFWDPISGPIFPNRGDQERFWKMTRRFVENLGSALGMDPSKINVLYPDAGVAAMLSYQWKKEEEGGGVGFKINSLMDRLPVSKDDELVIVACPDPFGAEECIRLVRSVGEQDEREGREYRPVVLFNPRLNSGDVGLGLNARRMRSTFLNNFVVTYSLRPINEVGSVYRRYPGMWKVFLEDEQAEGRYKLIAERPARPAGEALDAIVMQATGQMGAEGEAAPQGLLGQLGGVMRSMQYFMKSLSN